MSIGRKLAWAAIRRRMGMHIDPPQILRNRGPEQVEPDFSDDDFVYPRLNWLLFKLHKERPGQLRPHFTFGVLHAARLAQTLGLERISVIEFGVAGGNGLIALEKTAEGVEKLFGVGIDVYGFDTGKGLPKPTDYRDLPNLYLERAYPMEAQALRARLSRAELIIGMVEDTVPEFLKRSPAPVGFISVDLDYYSSTMHAFQLFEAGHDVLLPRVHCYFDDIMGLTCSQFTGERMAISDFNDTHEKRKITPIFGLKYFLPKKYARAQWSEMFYLAHMFDHPLYNDFDGLINEGVGNHTGLDS